MSVQGRFDWPRLMQAGLCRLGLMPAQFWALTPAEFLLLLGESAGPGPLDRRRLEALVARFPDHDGEKADG